MATLSVPRECGREGPRSRLGGKAAGLAAARRGSRDTRPFRPFHKSAPAAPRARVAGGAEEPLLARHIRSSTRRRQDAYAAPRRRRTRTRSRPLSLRLRERLCSPAPTPSCRGSSRPTASSSIAGVAGHAGGAEAAERRPRGRPSIAGFHQFGPCLRRGSGGRLCPIPAARASARWLLL